MSVPYTFANDTGNIALSQLDVNFANVKAQANTATVVAANAQPNITSVGTLNSLSVAGNIATSGYVLGNGSALTGIVVSGANAAQLIGTTLSSNVANSSLTSVGILNGLAVLGTISTNGTVTAAYFNGDGSGLTAINGANVVGNLAANVTSVGTLTSLSVSGNTVSGNLITGGLISATGNVKGGNLLTTGAVSATGNVTTAGYFVGTFLGNISGNLTVPGSNTQVLFNNNGNAGASAGFVFVNSNSAVTVSGNVTAGNFVTSGLISAGGNVTGLYFVGSGSTLTSITGANVTGTVANATYAVSAATATTAGTVTTNAQPNITSVGTLTSVGVSGNILTNGLISAAGNITGAYIVGDGSRLNSLAGANVTGTVANATYAVSAGSVANATFATSAGVVTTNAQPNITSVGTLTSLTVGGNISTASAISATGNIVGAGLYVGSNTVMLSNVARYTWVSNIAPSAGQGNIGDIWYQTV